MLDAETSLQVTDIVIFILFDYNWFSKHPDRL